MYEESLHLRVVVFNLEKRTPDCKKREFNRPDLYESVTTHCEKHALTSAKRIFIKRANINERCAEFVPGDRRDWTWNASAPMQTGLPPRYKSWQARIAWVTPLLDINGENRRIVTDGGIHNKYNSNSVSFIDWQLDYFSACVKWAATYIAFQSA